MTSSGFPPVRAVLVDLDGTLVDTLGEITAAVNAMLKEAGREPASARTVSEAIGEGATTLVTRLLGADLVERWFPVYMDHYRAHNGSTATLYPNAREGLARLRADGLKLACVTNKPRELVAPLLERLDVLDAFDLVLGASDGVRKKPAPDALLLAAERLGVEATACVMVGDSKNDALAAQAARMRTLTVPYGYPGTSGDDGLPETLLARGITCAIVPDLLAAADWIARSDAPTATSPTA